MPDRKITPPELRRTIEVEEPRNTLRAVRAALVAFTDELRGEEPDRLKLLPMVENALGRVDAILYPPPPPERQCSVCGINESDSEWGHLIDVSVVVADGEEGYAWVEQLLCDSHFPAIQQTLLDAGFKDHRHGGINFLEDERCPGATGPMENCPTPHDEEHGHDPYQLPILVKPRPR